VNALLTDLSVLTPSCLSAPTLTRHPESFCRDRVVADFSLSDCTFSPPLAVGIGSTLQGSAATGSVTFPFTVDATTLPTPPLSATSEIGRIPALSANTASPISPTRRADIALKFSVGGDMTKMRDAVPRFGFDSDFDAYDNDYRWSVVVLALM
jgi:hypothetical protein